MQKAWRSNSIGLGCQEIKKFIKYLMNILNDMLIIEMWNLNKQWIYSWNLNIWRKNISEISLRFLRKKFRSKSDNKTDDEGFKKYIIIGKSRKGNKNRHKKRIRWIVEMHDILYFSFFLSMVTVACRQASLMITWNHWWDPIRKYP